MKDITCKVAVIGGGPGGYVAAIRAGQLGLDTVLIEKKMPGGTCLTVGCIPSKALIHAADEFSRLRHFSDGGAMGITASAPAIDLRRTVEWKDGIVSRLTSGVSGLLKKAKVKTVFGTARFLDGKTIAAETDMGEQIIRAENVIIATGSVPVELSALPFSGRVMSSTEALALTTVPKTLAVVGGGYIGLEIGTAYAKLGASVTVVEAAEQILPLYDAELIRPVAKRLQELGVRVLTGAAAKGLAPDGEGVVVRRADGTDETIAAERVLVTVGRRPRTDGFGLDEIRPEMAGRFIRIDERCRTSMRGVYAVGDVTGEPMLAHRAMAQGEMVAEIIAGMRRGWDKRCIPAVCFTDPEIVSVGRTAEEARAAGLEVKTGSFPFQANGRAMTMGREDGFIRVVCEANSHLVLGIQAVGAGISELSTAFAQVIEMGARLEDVAGTIHAHPTLGEALHEASLRILGHSLHI